MFLQVNFSLEVSSRNKEVRYERRENSDATCKHDKKVHCDSNSNYVWCLPQDYNTEEDPFQYARLVPEKPLPWEYDFTFRVKDISKIKDKSQLVSISMYFGVGWYEPRLNINETAKAWSEVKMGPTDQVNISPLNLKYLWYPELEIYGLENFRRYTVLKEMSGVRIKKDRTIHYELRVEVTISCIMNFDNYPLDHHRCLFQIGSYYGSNKTIQCKSNLTYDTFKQKNIQHSVRLTSLPIQNRTVSLVSGNYAVCGFSIHLTRKRMQNFVQIYMPSFMFVVASWISFVVKPDIVPGRMALLVTILLVQLNLFNNAKDKAPVSASNINAGDLYLVFSMFCVFSALLEYAVVLVMMKLQPDWTLQIADETIYKRKSTLAWDSTDPCKVSKNITSGNEEKLASASDKVRTNTTGAASNIDNKHIDDIKHATEYICNKLDLISVCFAPIIFTIFHFVYCIKYLVLATDE